MVDGEACSRSVVRRGGYRAGPRGSVLRGGDGHNVGYLVWLREKLGEDLLDALVLTTGSEAYRRDDGIGRSSRCALGPYASQMSRPARLSGDDLDGERA